MFIFNKGHASTRSKSRPRSKTASLATDSNGDHHDFFPPPADAHYWNEHHRSRSRSTSLLYNTHGERRHAMDRTDINANGKRTSVFALRSRSSSTAASNPSTHHSRASTMTDSKGPSRRPSVSDIPTLFPTQPTSNPDSSADDRTMSLFSRNRRSRRSSKLRSTMVLDGIDPDDRVRRNRAKWLANRTDDEFVSRPYISKPFDFQHLTHTGRQQFPTRVLDQASENELVAEYWAVRASQRPRPELHGIKAEDLHFRNFSSDALDRVASSEAVSPVSARTPPALSRKVSKDLPMLPETQPSSPTSGRSMRHSRSVESFSQPYIKHRVSPPFASIQPPPRVSSRMALTRYDEPDRPRPLSIYESTSPPPSSTRLAGSRASGMWDRVAFNPVASPASPDAGVAVAVAEGVHAVTTADDVAVAAAAASPGYGLALENVPEEPEGYFDARPRPAARASDGRTTPESQSPPDSPGVMMAFRERRPSAVARKHDSCSTASSSSSRSASRCFDSLGSPFQSPAHGQRAPRFASFKRQSVFFRGDSTSWEDDIDYCYEHAAEADCDFDWDRNSLGEEDEEGVESEPFAAGGQVSASLLASFDSLTTRTTEADEDELPEEPEERKPSGSRARGHFYPGPFRPSLVVTDAPLPELDYDTTLKTATTDGATTPSDVFGGPQPPYSPSANGEVSADFGVKAGKADEAMREAMYEDIITTAVAAGEYDDDDAAADRHYPFLHPEEQQHQHLVNGPHHAASTAGSTRSSRTRLSKRSSYDSSVRSTGTASVFFSARRSAGSVGSLPELVWSSRRATRKTLEAPTVDAFADFGFFARFADEKANDEADVKAMDEAREDEIVAAVSPDEPMPTATAVTEASTPMAAMASTTSTTTHTFHHDRSASEGAAKLLFGSSPTRPARKRAASSGAGAMLSLFPPPVPTRVIQ